MAEEILLILFRSTASEAVFLDKRMANRGDRALFSSGVSAITSVKNLPYEVLPVLVRRSLSKRRDSRCALVRAMD